MRSIEYPCPFSIANSGSQFNCQHTGASQAIHLKDVHDRFQLTKGPLLHISTDDTSSNCSMTLELQSTLQASGIEWPALRNHIPCMAQVIQLAFGEFMSSLGVKGHTKGWEAHESHQQFGENDRIDIGKSLRLRKEGNARISKVSAMRPGLEKITEKVHISRYFEWPETTLHIEANDCCMDYADTWLSKRVHWLSKIHRPHRSTTYYGCEDSLEFDTGVAWASLPVTGIHLPVAPESNIQWIPATFHTMGWIYQCQVHHGSFEAIPILDVVDV